MAHIVRCRMDSAKRIPTAHLFLIMIVAIVLIVFMLDPAEHWQENIYSVLGTVAVIAVIVGFALNKVNPMGWKRIFRKAEFERLQQADQAVLDSLKALNNHHHVFYNFNFELLHVEFLVLGPRGIFVIGKIPSTETLRIDDGTLMAGENSLARQTGNLWRICHLINIVIKKGYKTEIMPRPILIVPSAGSTAVNEFDGISIIEADELVPRIRRYSPDDIPFEQVQGFAAYLKKRYFE